MISLNPRTSSIAHFSRLLKRVMPEYDGALPKRSAVIGIFQNLRFSGKMRVFTNHFVNNLQVVKYKHDVVFKGTENVLRPCFLQDSLKSDLLIIFLNTFSSISNTSLESYELPQKKTPKEMCE